MGCVSSTGCSYEKVIPGIGRVQILVNKEDDTSTAGKTTRRSRNEHNQGNPQRSTKRKKPGLSSQKKRKSNRVRTKQSTGLRGGETDEEEPDAEESDQDEGEYQEKEEEKEQGDEENDDERDKDSEQREEEDEDNECDDNGDLLGDDNGEGDEGEGGQDEEEEPEGAEEEEEVVEQEEEEAAAEAED